MIENLFHKGNQLFPDYQMIKRENPSQMDFEQVFASDNKLIGEIINDSFEMMKSERMNRPPHFRNRNWHADTMNSNIQGKLIDQFGGLVKMQGGRFFLKMNGKILYFKKLGSKTKKPSHITTRNATKLMNNYATLFEEPNPIIWIGYCVDSSWTNLTGIYAVAIDENEINWISDLSNYNSDLSEVYSINKNGPDIDPVSKPLVTIKTMLAKAE